jgi:O-acetyl-ADP-ribose deacetylase (regulator of RNase III)
MYTAQVGNLLEKIEELELDGIMSAANGQGPMGRGIAGSIREAGGDSIMRDAFKVCSEQNPQPGQAYSTISGLLKERGIKRIIHATTMKRPGGPTSYDIIRDAFRSALVLAKEEGIIRLGCTALGTGVGGRDAKIVAEIMGHIAWEESDINIFFVDLDQEFIDTLNHTKR